MESSEYILNQPKTIVKSTRNLSTFIHLAFWASYLLLSIFILEKLLKNIYPALFVACINVIGVLPLVYFFINFLLPRYWSKADYLKLFSFLILAILASAIVRFTLVKLLVYNNFPISFDTSEFRIIAQFLIGGLALIILAIPLKLSDVYFKNRELQTKFDRHKLEAELKFLKTQVNPHFLFNALNNIYSLAFTNSESTAEMILKLSQMMSFMLYDCEDETILIEKEIEYLNNYIALQQLKQEGELSIQFDVIKTPNDFQIPPMLFIPFFENAFKHGNIDNSSKGYVKSKIEISDDKLEFYIFNTKEAGSRFTLEKSGIGIANVKDRLQLIYPSNHKLKIQQSDYFFEVKLTINIS